MLDFCLIFDEARGGASPVPGLEDVCLEVPDKVHSLAVGPWRLDVFASSNGSGDLLGTTVAQDRGGLALLIGQGRDRSGQYLNDVAAFLSGDAVGGNYLFVRLDADGRVDVQKSAICAAPLYFAALNGKQALASRAALAFRAVEPGSTPTVSSEFLRWSSTYAIGCTSASIFEGVQHVQMNQKVFAGPTGLSLGTPDVCFLHDPGLRDLFDRDRKTYWDQAFECLETSVSAVRAVDAPIEFPLSGGKDSRLLLAMTRAVIEKDRDFRVFTNGPQNSPEVRAAAMVCEVLGLVQEVHDNTSAETSKPPSIDAYLMEHAHITEAEMSPIDLTWGFGKRSVVQLYGQEGGLRNMAPRDDIHDAESLQRWMTMHVNYGDRCGVMLAGCAYESLSELHDFLNKSLAAGIPAGDVPSLHRILYRLGRWVARTWTFNNNRGFAPYPFVDFDVIRYTFNSGAASRLREEFHVEMLYRLDKRLVELPFALQSWAPNALDGKDLRPADPLDWPDQGFRRRALPRHDALVRHFERLRAFLLDHSGPATDQLIDRDRLAQVDLSDFHESSYQCFWQILQAALFERIGRLDDLRNGTTARDLGLPSFD